jgi:hypothetical protein
MPELNFSIPALFDRAFNINRGKPFEAPADAPPVAAPAFETPEAGDGEGTEFVSVRNALNARLPDGRLVFMPVAIDGYTLPNEPTITFIRKKRIVTTAMAGAKLEGDVKELISLGDWDITIRGIAINYASTAFYPEDLVREIEELEERREALPIVCALTSLLGIYNIVIKEIRLPEMLGIQHAQAYELICVSDRDFILEID